MVVKPDAGFCSGIYCQSMESGDFENMALFIHVVARVPLDCARRVKRYAHRCAALACASRDGVCRDAAIPALRFAADIGGVVTGGDGGRRRGGDSLCSPLTQHMDPGLRQALPEGFRMPGFPVHADFDRIALDAEVPGDPQHTLSQPGETLSKCVACHEAYQIRAGASP